MIGASFSILQNPGHMVLSIAEIGARVFVTRFLSHFIRTGAMTWARLVQSSHIIITASSYALMSCLLLLQITRGRRHGFHVRRIPKEVSSERCPENPFSPVLLEGNKKISSNAKDKRRRGTWPILRFSDQVMMEADLGLADSYINGDFSFVDKHQGLLNLFQVI